MRCNSSLKILEWDKIGARANYERMKNVRIVLVTGAWDIMHSGHVTYLEAASQHGDALFVGVDTNARILRIRNDNKRPILDQTVRLRTIAALACVDCAFLFHASNDPTDLVALIRPVAIAVSPTTKEDPECGRFGFAEAMGIKVVVIASVFPIHTSGIIQDIVAKYGNGA